MNYYLIIIFFVSTVFILPIFNSVYGYGVSQIGSLNEFNGYGFIPIKNNILPQYDGSIPQSISKVNAEADSKTGVAKNSITSTNNASPSVGVKILSPASGKEIPVGSLTIFGVSTDNEKSDCTVLVDWNNEKPFQKAKAAGPYGADDYSSWTFTYSSSYHSIENGLNDLTSKIECLENSKVTTKWHTINVTGVVTNEANPITATVIHDPLGILPQLKTLSTSSSANTQNISSNETTLASNNLLTHVELSKKLMFPGESQNFTVKISDSETSENVVGAYVVVKIMQGNITLNQYNGSSDNLGEYSQSWNILPNTPSGIYNVVVAASADGYQPASLSGSFEVQRQLLVEASLLKRLVVPGDQQTVDVKILDANTKENIPGADVVTKIGQKKAFNVTSNASGTYSHTWNISSDIPAGKYNVMVKASADGYQPGSLSGSFEVQRQLLVEAALSHDLVIPGDEQTVEVKVVDAHTNEIITGANVAGKIGANKFTASTDDNGLVSHTWDTPSTSGGNDYKVVLDVTADGYPKITKTSSFKMDKPQNLLEPPISNYESNIIKVKSNDLSNYQEGSQNKLQECANILSGLDCNAINDKPTPNPATDDKPTPNPATDDKPTPNPATDYNPLLNNNIMEDIPPEENQEEEKNQEEENIGFDFLGSVTN
ncbi:MAG TPA: carboxypeptidase-like regulatory domain-containing protein [Nitrososphaeraceae archaeon]|nr:carboxypeptidase-like regulatory domain-containing protein [Nitrososphaeraceae archaeon]